jgi:FkbM family methyltransferase
MARFVWKPLAAKIIVSILNLLPQSTLWSFETILQYAQGKGWGAATVPREVRAARELLPAPSSDNPIVLDVGANIGNWTSHFLTISQNARIFAFEPSTAAFAELQARFAGDKRVTPVNFALGDSIGTKTLYSDLPGSALASLLDLQVSYEQVFSFQQETECTTIDIFCHDYGIQPQVIKLDVEGYERTVLAGAERTLLTTDVVQFEFGRCNIASRTFFKDFFDFFTERGFRIFRLLPRGLNEITVYREADETFQVTNFLAQRSRT